MKQDQKEREGLSKLTCRYELGFRAREGEFWDFLLFLSTLRSRRVGNKGVRSETVKITATWCLITVVGPMCLIHRTRCLRFHGPIIIISPEDVEKILFSMPFSMHINHLNCYNNLFFFIIIFNYIKDQVDDKLKHIY
jgi:hypothetical protein